MSNLENLEMIIKNTSHDKFSPQNISTFINKYLCDTIYILNLHINSYLSKNFNNNTSSLISEKIGDEINTMKKINNSLEKEIFYLNNPKKEEISKFIEILCQRNNLLNILMNNYFEKVKSIEIKEKILHTRMKLYSSLTKNKSIEKYYQIKNNSSKEKKIDNYMKIKNNNEFNHKKFSKYLNTYDNEREQYYKRNSKNNNNNKMNLKNKINLNKSYDVLSINNIDTSCTYNNCDININMNMNNTCYDIKYIKKNIKNNKGRNSEPKIKLRKVNSVAKLINKDSIIKNFKRNSCINLKSREQINKLNLDQLNNITSNINIKML